MARYFSNVSSLEQLRKQYRDLLKQYHPDNVNGSTEACQEINAEYDQLFKVLKDKHESKSTDNNENNAKTDFNNMKYDFSEDAKLREVLQQIITFEGINIEIVGCWIWVDGNTYDYKDTLKNIGFKWAREKKYLSSFGSWVILNSIFIHPHKLISHVLHTNIPSDMISLHSKSLNCIWYAPLIICGLA